MTLMVLFADFILHQATKNDEYNDSFENND